MRRPVPRSYVLCPQALSSLVNITIFLLKFIALRLYYDSAQSRLPIVARRLPNNTTQLLAVVPANLVPPGTGLVRSLDRPRRRSRKRPSETANTVSVAAESRASSAAAEAADALEPAGPPSASKPPSLVPAAELQPSMEMQPSHASAEAGSSAARADVGDLVPRAFNLNDLHPSAMTAQVLVPVSVLPREPLVPAKPLVRLRRSKTYQAFAMVMMPASAAAMLSMLWWERESMPIGIAIVCLFIFMMSVESTRLERHLFAAVVRPQLAGREPVHAVARP